MTTAGDGPVRDPDRPDHSERDPVVAERSPSRAASGLMVAVGVTVVVAFLLWAFLT